MGTGISMARNAFVRSLCASAIAMPVFAAQDKVDYSGSWKANCEDPIGLLIKPLRNGLYSISFCKQTVCAPGAYRPDTRIDKDPMYETLSPTKIRLKHREGGHSTYIKCSDTTPSR
jgi:hypothetical protein